MPIVFMNVRADWDNLVAVGGVLPAAGVAYGDGTDEGGTQIYLPFTYQGEDYHISISLGSGGVSSCFHVTSEKPKPIHLAQTGKKAGTTYTVKNKPSAYYDFRIVGGGVPTVEFSPATSVEILGKKTQKVFSASFTNPLTNTLKDIMRAFILHMYGLGPGHATAG